jgi:iduronate 2-sulfatase
MIPISRRLLVFALLCPFVLMGAQRRNILFIAVDDLNNHLGCYSNTIVRSPNIDRLAATGVRFDRAYCQFPLCSPSRVSIMTGLRPDTTRIYDLQHDFRKGTNVAAALTMPQFFHSNGYFSARSGKIFHYGVPGDIGKPGLDDPLAWQEARYPRGRDKDEEDLVTNLNPGARKPNVKPALGAALAWYESKGEDEEYTDALVADEAIRLMTEHKDKPFFLGVGFYRPHVPWIVPKKYFDMYPMEKILLPKGPEGDRDDVPPVALHVKVSNYGRTDEEVREAKRAYYAAISYVDGQVGRVLDALDSLGLATNTIVVLWGDHGWHLGEHGLWQKMSLFEESARVPLIIRAPGMTGNGTSSPRVVESLDVFPTVAELANVKAPASLAGKSLVPLLKKPTAKWDRPAFTQVTRGGTNSPIMGYSIRTERWRYTEWDGGKRGTELYDHDNDSQEFKNLAQQDEFAAVVKDLSQCIATMKGR